MVEAKLVSILVTTNEPKKIKELFTDRIEIPMSFDIKLYTEIGTVGIERKKVPGDLIASVEDGRLGKEILAMREECQIKIVLFHGVMRYNKNGTLKLGKRTSYRWTDKGIRNLRRTLEFVEGCYIEYAKNNTELVKVVNEIQAYLDEEVHLSTKGRSPIRTDWIKSTREERVRYFYDGLPGIAVVGATKLAQKFPNPLDLYQASTEEIAEIPRFGMGTAIKIHNFLRGVQ